MISPIRMNNIHVKTSNDGRLFAARSFYAFGRLHNQRKPGTEKKKNTTVIARQHLESEVCREVVVHEPFVGPREEIDMSESSDCRQASKCFSEVGVNRGSEKVSAGFPR